MSNSLTGRLWTVDTIGLLSNSPVCIQRVVFRPAAASQILQLGSYSGSGNCLAANSKDKSLGTITSTTTLTANTASDTPATMAVGDVFQIYASTGAAANLTKSMITTAGNPSTGVLVCAGAGWTNESSKYYSWVVYPGVKEIYLVGGASDASGVTLDFGPNGRWLPNLTLVTLGGGAVDLYLL